MICRRVATLLVLAAAFVFSLGAATESLVDRLLRVAGITATPGQMRGPTDEAADGNVWMVNVDGQGASALTADGGYRSPVFAPATGTIYALKGEIIVRLSSKGGNPVAVQKVARALKLVGFDAKNPNELVLLLGEGGKGSPLVAVSLGSGKITPLPYDAGAERDRAMLAQVRGEERVYGDTVLYTKTESKRGLSRQIDWTDVYIKRGAAAPRNISACGGINCAQPALSLDGRSVAFIKSGS